MLLPKQRMCYGIPGCGKQPINGTRHAAAMKYALRNRFPSNCGIEKVRTNDSHLATAQVSTSLPTHRRRFRPPLSVQIYRMLLTILSLEGSFSNTHSTLLPSQHENRSRINSNVILFLFLRLSLLLLDMRVGFSAPGVSPDFLVTKRRLPLELSAQSHGQTIMATVAIAPGGTLAAGKFRYYAPRRRSHV